ncbi:MAG: hypothetical protein H6R04_729 [Burkholderiaceae bacterium]|nr:hypothetical protein [Burkholderiaceae bacterium]
MLKSLFTNLVGAARARMSLWLIVSVLLLASIAVTAPRLLPVSLYKLSLITTAAWVAYWIDRGLFPYARPDGFTMDTQQLLYASAMIRRALIISAAMIGVALGA